MKTTAPRNLPFRAPAGSGSTTPPPVTFSVGQERLVVSFVSPASINLSYSNAAGTTLPREPVAIAELVPTAGGARRLVDLMKISPAMQSTARAGVLNTQPPSSTNGILFYDGQRRIFVDGFTGDSMDDDDFTTLPPLG